MKKYTIISEVETDVFSFVDLIHMIEKVMNGKSSKLLTLKVIEQTEESETTV